MIIDGKQMAQGIRQELKDEASRLKTKPILSVIQFGNDPASDIYINNKQKACAEVGIDCRHVKITEDIINKSRPTDLVNVIAEQRDSHAIIVQLPLPEQISHLRNYFCDHIPSWKDVDVFNPTNVGLLLQNRPYLKPCTPQAVLEMLRRSGISVHGRRVAIVNRSMVVGIPLATMLMQDDEFANATVTVCHEYTNDIASVLNEAEIIITAVGKREDAKRPFLLTADMVQQNAVVIDVGITRLRNGKIAGDADFDNLLNKVSKISKVPGGVGLLTVAMLCKNVIAATKTQTEGRLF